MWWGELIVAGLDKGYFPNAGKCWLVIEPNKEETSRSIFEEKAINIKTEGRKHLGAVVRKSVSIYSTSTVKARNGWGRGQNWQSLLFRSLRPVTQRSHLDSNNAGHTIFSDNSV